MGIDKDNYDLEEDVIRNVLTYTKVIILQFYWFKRNQEDIKDENNACIHVILNEDICEGGTDDEIHQEIVEVMSKKISEWEKENYMEWNINDIVRELEEANLIRKFVNYKTFELYI